MSPEKVPPSPKTNQQGQNYPPQNQPIGKGGAGGKPYYGEEIVAESQASMTTADQKLETPQSTPQTKLKSGLLYTPKSYWGWQAVWWTIVGIFSLVGGVALVNLFKAPPVPDCDQISPLSADGQRLYCAHKAAESKDVKRLQDALDLVNSWSEEHPLYPQGQKLIREWSKLLLSVATQKIEQGDLAGALETVKKIPKSSPIYDEVENTTAIWQSQWDDGQKLYDQAVLALKSQDWTKASAYAGALSQLNNQHWRVKRYKEVLEKIAIEQKAFEKLKDARQLINQQTAQEYGEAIALADKIDKNLYVWQKAEQDITKWSRQLINMAIKKINQKDLAGAIAILDKIPATHPLHQEAEDLVRLGNAKAAVWNLDNQQRSSLENLTALLDGKAAASQINSNSPYYQEAQTKIQEIEKELTAWHQIELAGAIANIGQPWALQIAAEQVALIQPNQVGGKKAATLGTQWQRDQQMINARPHLVLAKQLAKSETVDGFNSAIQQASYIPQGHPLRIESQTWIAQWRKQVQVIEDQPILAEAKALAKEGKLTQAITAAAKIPTGRALHPEAQKLIGEWTTQKQIGEDQPILNEATALANQGRYGEAINLAYQIGYDRALYNDAQNAIARWTAERDALTPPAPSPAPAPTYVQPAPSPMAEPQYSQPAPAPSPEPQYYEPAPAPSPESQYYEPAPAPAPVEESYYEPAPATVPESQTYSEPPPVEYSEPAPVEAPPAAEYEQLPPAEEPASETPATNQENLLQE
jgi:hypothetical protein